MTREELKIVLKSKENKLAGKAREAIREGKPVAELQKLVEAGAAQIFYERNPAHPRSSFLTHHVIDTCFESSFGIVEQSEGPIPGTNTAVLGHVLASTGREEHFKYLLEQNFTPGSNSYRGMLFPHILDSCFYTRDMAKQASARIFAKILVESGKFDLTFYARNNYGWTNHPSGLEFMISIGLDPTAEGVVDCALNYVGCSPNSGYTAQDRVDVVKQLIELGAVPKKDLRRAVSWQQIRKTITDAGLLEILASHGVIDLEPSANYLRWAEVMQVA